jgi:hypothetical protein
VNTVVPSSLRDDGSSLKALGLVPFVLWLLLGFVLLGQFTATDRKLEPLVTPAFVFWSGVDAALAVSAVVLFAGGYMLTAMAGAIPTGDADDGRSGDESQSGVT